MANIKITDLTAYGNPTSTDVLPIVDVGADVTKKVSIADLFKNAASGTESLPGIAFDGDPDTGIYRPGADQVAISTNGQGRLFIDSSGKVGLGTSSPGSLLSLYAGASAEYFRCGGNGVTTRDLVLSASTGTNAGDTHTINASGSSGRLILSTASSPRMTVDSSGHVGIGTTSPAYQLQLATDSAGKPSTNTWTIVSDERIKEEIELADLDLCYEAVKNIPLKRFKWKDEVYTEEQAYDRRKLGWIAQDVEAVFPKAVRQHEFKYNQVFEEVVIPAVPAELDDDGNVITEEQPERIEKGELISEEVIEDCRDLNSDQLYAAMYGAIQKLISKVELLEAEVQALKAA